MQLAVSNAIWKRDVEGLVNQHDPLWSGVIGDNLSNSLRRNGLLGEHEHSVLWIDIRVRKGIVCNDLGPLLFGPHDNRNVHSESPFDRGVQVLPDRFWGLGPAYKVPTLDVSLAAIATYFSEHLLQLDHRQFVIAANINASQ